MKGRVPLRAAIAASLVALLASHSAHADSTTGTALTLEGRPVPGTSVIAHVVVTGKHLVTNGGFTVTGGDIEVTVNGTLAAKGNATAANSHVTDSGCVQRDSYQACIRTKYISDHTEIALAVALPKGVQSYSVVARYTGDADSHDSTSPATVLKPIYPAAVTPVLMLFN